mmetsp:Transcript_29633/g.99755  ORF Transcript_29633/g.99755 Transcript_29633/m.99755 type:complete len:304 (+) Transcript_29633:184-1095(+)
MHACTEPLLPSVPQSIMGTPYLTQSLSRKRRASTLSSAEKTQSTPSKNRASNAPPWAVESASSRRSTAVTRVVSPSAESPPATCTARAHAVAALLHPTSSALKRNCLERFETSMESSSQAVMAPTRSMARFFNSSHPVAPAPTTSTWQSFKAFRESSGASPTSAESGSSPTSAATSCMMSCVSKGLPRPPREHAFKTSCAATPPHAAVMYDGARAPAAASHFTNKALTLGPLRMDPSRYSAIEGRSDTSRSEEHRASTTTGKPRSPSGADSRRPSAAASGKAPIRESWPLTPTTRPAQTTKPA